MKIVTAIDSFKGSLSSLKAGQASLEGIKRVLPDAEVIIRPVADGGEGTVDTLVEGLGGEKYTINVTGPLGNVIEAEYGIVENNTAIIEMSASAGITLVPIEKRNPLNTTTYGVGEMILDAVNKGCRNFIVGIGGSATNDGGIGMLQALGFGMLDCSGKSVQLGGTGLKDLCSITDDNVPSELKDCTFNIACDVKNPLCGENGCSAIYGPQKGADQDTILKMDKWLLNYAELTKKYNKNSNKDFPGTGAAGGMGFAFMSFLNGRLTSGIELILAETKLEKYLESADIVITGEGRLDRQTSMGKTPAGVAKLAKKYNLPVVAFSGCVTDEARLCNDCGIDAYFPILRNICSLDEALDESNAYKNMVDTVEQAFRLIKAFGIDKISEVK